MIEPLPSSAVSASGTPPFPIDQSIFDIVMDAPAPSLKPAGTRFEVTIGRKGYRDGVHWIECKNEQDGAEVDQAPTWICSPLRIEALTRDETGSEWGRLLVFDDRDRRRHQWAMPCSMLATDGADLRAELLRQGLDISSASKARKLLIDYVQQADPEGDGQVRHAYRLARRCVRVAQGNVWRPSR